MQPSATGVFAVSCLLACLIGLLDGSPQHAYWLPYQMGIPRTTPIETISPPQLTYGYNSFPESPYESIDDFRRNQVQQLGNVEDIRIREYSYDHQQMDQMRNHREMDYQNLMQVTENPGYQGYNQETIRRKEKKENYYQHYVPSGDDGSLRVQDEELNAIPKHLEAKMNRVDGESGIFEKVDSLRKMLTDKSYVPTVEDVDVLNSLEEEMMAEASMPEEAKRVVRQARRPGFLWTLARVVFETFNDTKSAAQQISKIINDNTAPETPTRRPNAANVVTTMAPIVSQENPQNVTTTSTTAAPFRLTRTEFQGILRRNLRGLVRLFNIEWKEAMDESRITAREFGRELRNEIRPYLLDNPAVKL